MTANEFKVNTYAYGRDSIHEDGRWSVYSGKWEINTSSILTRLIQEAGRYCERFASDLFIDWNTVEEWLSEADQNESRTFLFGFRQSGIDHTEFVLCKAEDKYSYGNLESCYRSLWKLDAETTMTEVRMSLGRVL